jgi:hypothetical protein
LSHVCTDYCCRATGASLTAREATHIYSTLETTDAAGPTEAAPQPPGGWPVGSAPSSSPQGLETRSRKRARTDSASSPSADSNGSFGSASAPRGPPAASPPIPRRHRQRLQDLASRHRPTDRRQACLRVVRRCQGRPALRQHRLGRRGRVPSSQLTRTASQ